jgi:hypothetical protein
MSEPCCTSSQSLVPFLLRLHINDTSVVTEFVNREYILTAWRAAEHARRCNLDSFSHTTAYTSSFMCCSKGTTTFMVELCNIANETLVRLVVRHETEHSITATDTLMSVNDVLTKSSHVHEVPIQPPSIPEKIACPARRRSLGSPAFG